MDAAANASSGAPLTLDATYLYEAENYTIEVAVRGNASVVAGAAVRNADPALVEVECSVESPASAGVSMDVAVLNGKAPARQSAEDYAQDGAGAEVTPRTMRKSASPSPRCKATEARNLRSWAA